MNEIGGQKHIETLEKELKLYRKQHEALVLMQLTIDQINEPKKGEKDYDKRVEIYKKQVEALKTASDNQAKLDEQIAQTEHKIAVERARMAAEEKNMYKERLLALKQLRFEDDEQVRKNTLSIKERIELYKQIGRAHV